MPGELVAAAGAVSGLFGALGVADGIRRRAAYDRLTIAVLDPDAPGSAAGPAAAPNVPLAAAKGCGYCTVLRRPCACKRPPEAPRVAAPPRPGRHPGLCAYRGHHVYAAEVRGCLYCDDGGDASAPGYFPAMP